MNKSILSLFFCSIILLFVANQPLICMQFFSGKSFSAGQRNPVGVSGLFNQTKNPTSFVPGPRFLGLPYTAYNRMSPTIFPVRRAYDQKRSLYHPAEAAGLGKAIVCPILRDMASPVNGISLIESGFIDTLYEYGPSQNSVVELIRGPKLGLFNKIGNDLRVTQINPGCALSPELTADIVAGLLDGDGSLDQARQSIVADWRRTYKEVRNRDVTKSTVEKQLKLIEDAQDNSNNSVNQGLFPQNFGVSLLLSHLYRNGTKQDSIRYLRALSKHFPEKINEEIIAAGLAKTYTHEELSAYSKHYSKESMDSYFQDYEKAIAARANKLQIENNIPPLARQGVYSYKSGSRVPDCCETAFRNLWNLILSRPGSRIFDLSLIPSSIPLDQGFRNFYERYADFKDINTVDAGQAWMNLVSGRDNIEYVRSGYEIEPLLDNILLLMNMVLKTNGKSFEEISQLLSSSEQTVKLQPEKNNLSITVIKKNNTISAVLDITPRAHAFFKVGDQANRNSNDFENYASLVKSTSSSKLYSAIYALPLFVPKHVGFTDFKLEENNLAVACMDWYSQNLFDPNIRVQVMQKMCGLQKKYPSLFSMLQELCTKAPHIDKHLMSSVFSSIVQHSMYSDHDWLKNFVTMHPLGLYGVMQSVGSKELFDETFILPLLQHVKSMILEGPKSYSDGKWSSVYTDDTIWNQNIFEGIQTFYEKHLDDLYSDKDIIDAIAHMSVSTQDTLLSKRLALLIVRYNLEKKVESCNGKNVEMLVRGFENNISLAEFNDFLENVPGFAAHAGTILENIQLDNPHEIKRLIRIIIQRNLYQDALFKKHLIENPLGIYEILNNVAKLGQTKELLDDCCNTYLRFCSEGSEVYCTGKYRNIAPKFYEYTNLQGIRYTLLPYEGKVRDKYHFDREQHINFVSPLHYLAGQADFPLAVFIKLLKTKMGKELVNVSVNQKKPNALSIAEYIGRKEVIDILTLFGAQ